MNPPIPPAEAAAIDQLLQLQSPCRICPRGCRVLRDRGELGYCRAPVQLVVPSSGPHFGEESCLVGTGGSGAIFLAGCPLQCVFCQNADISLAARGPRWTIDDAVYTMLRLADGGAENINFVTPTHYAPQVAQCILEARRRGLRIPIVYNSSAYDSVDTLRLLDGLIDIYLPDFKFWTPEAGRRYANAPDYADRAREAIREMHRQVGDLHIEREVAVRGLLVRHLVMPEATDEGRAILDFLYTDIGPDTVVNIMAQYRPLNRASDFPEINRLPTDEEVLALRVHAERLGLRMADHP